MNNTDSVRARTNPVYLTAKTALCLMADAGVDNAEKLAGKMGITLKDYGMEDPDLRLGNELVVEAKYRTMCQLILGTGYKVNVDLPCGYTPKALALTEKGLRFIGLDLPIVAEEAELLILDLADHKDKIRFQGVDATNETSLLNALKGEVGPVCITTEGMMMYFTEDEASHVVSNIRSLLEVYGGCWITPDPEYMLQFFLTFQSVLGEKAMQKLLATLRSASGQSDVSLGGNSLLLHPENLPATMARAEAFLKGHGLRAERINLAENMPELSVYRKLSKEQVSAFKAAMGKCHYWKVTLDENRTAKEGKKEGAPFALETSVLNQEFFASLRGRMDTLTAPELLEAWEKQREGIQRAQIDCRELEYISSAGLRVLLLIRKGLPGGKLTLTGVGKEVMEILETTGFDSVFEIQE